MARKEKVNLCTPTLLCGASRQQNLLEQCQEALRCEFAMTCQTKICAHINEHGECTSQRALESTKQKIIDCI